MQKQFIIKTFATGFLAFVLAFSPIAAPKSEAWLTMAGVMLESEMDVMRAQILGMIMGSLKQAAIKAISSSVSGIVGGSSSQTSKIIGNYSDFLYAEPQQKASLYMNDYLSQITSGRGSSSGYIPADFEGFADNTSDEDASNDYSTRLIPSAMASSSLSSMGTAFAGNYIAQLKQSALAVITEQQEPTPTYVGNPSQNLFSGGNFNNLNLYLSGINNPWAFNINAQEKYQKLLDVAQDAARTEAIAGRGFKGTRQGDIITAPGSIIGDVMTHSLTIGFDVLANAQSVPEVITAAVQGIIGKSIQSGIGKAQEFAQQKIQGVASKATQAINTQASTNGPASIWKNPDLAR
ncbi:MAG: hypothetical protein UT50_C0003G0022 [Candidatus Moranbacteria bacterium GW2011_GWA2_39_41]|nr:MAG: hypothetical protein UT50_C0003G0022 [Candidatus Moranbacteria bacterium GW2011_GWA2_39_41]